MEVRHIVPRLHSSGGLAWLALFLVSALSCATGLERFGVPIAVDRVAQIEVGRSTRAEVLSLMGPPTFQLPAAWRPREDPPQLVAAPGERILLWMYRERRERFGTALVYTRFSQRTLTDTLMVVIDDRDVVTHVALGRETSARD